MELDYDKDIIIDKDNLHVEWLNQAQLFMKYAKQEISARRDMDMAKEAVELVKAEIDADIRANPMQFTGSDKKPTESAITSLILMDQRYKDAQQEFIDSRYDHGVLAVATRGFDQKKTSLENLVKLENREYFGSPVEPRDWSAHKPVTPFVEKAKDNQRTSKIKDAAKDSGMTKDISSRRRRVKRKRGGDDGTDNK